MEDSIEYELVNWKPRQVWKCQGECARFRHRDVIKGQLPAICCGIPAKLITVYSQPTPVSIVEPLPPERDEVLDSVMAHMQAAALLFPEPTQDSRKDAYKS